MTEPFDRWEDRLLNESAASFAYPAAPDLRLRVVARIPGHVQRAERRQRRLITVAAAGLLVATVTLTVTLLVLRDVRHAVADFLGLAVPGERISVAPAPLPGVTPTPLPPPRPLESVATPATLDEAERRLGFRPVVPTGLVATKVYLVDFIGIPAAVIRGPNYDLWQFKASEGFFGKQIFIGSTEVEQLTLDGLPAYWITGGPRLVTFFDTAGKEVAGTERTLTGHALVFARNGISYRIEGDLSREEALVIAATLTPK